MENETSFITLIDNEACESVMTLHEKLMGDLGFPSYYGKNLSALADCLSETAQPMSIIVDASVQDSHMASYLERFCQVCSRESLHNPNVSFHIVHRVA